MKMLVAGLIIGIFVAMSVSAQTSQESDRFAGVFSFEYPVTWETQSEDGVGHFFRTGNSEIRVRYYGPFFQSAQDLEVGNLQSLIEWLVTDVFETRDFNPSAVQDLSFGDYPGITYSFEEQSEGETYSRVFFLKLLPNDLVISGNMRSLVGTELDQADLSELQEVVSTVELTDTIEFYEGTMFDIPEGWQLLSAYDADFASAYLVNGPLHANLVLYPGYAGMAGLETPNDFYAWAYDKDYRDVEPLNRSEFQDTRVAGFDAVFDPVLSERLDADGLYERGFVSFVLPNNSAFVLHITSEDITDAIDPIYGLLDSLEPGRIFVCPLFPDPGTRIREEASTSSPVVRESEEDETLIALRAVQGDDGNRWFDVGEGFVRSDIVYHETKACSRISGY